MILQDQPSSSPMVGSPPPPECIPIETSNACEPTGEVGPMASTDNQRIAEMMILPYYWIQEIGPDGIDGRLTPKLTMIGSTASPKMSKRNSKL